MIIFVFCGKGLLIKKVIRFDCIFLVFQVEEKQERLKNILDLHLVCHTAIQNHMFVLRGANLKELEEEGVVAATKNKHIVLLYEFDFVC